MEKDKVVEQLKKNGYNAKNQNGVILIAYPEGTNDYKTFIEKVKTDIANIGYKGSWGCFHSKTQSGYSNEKDQITIDEYVE